VPAVLAEPISHRQVRRGGGSNALGRAVLGAADLAESAGTPAGELIRSAADPRRDFAGDLRRGNTSRSQARQDPEQATSPVRGNCLLTRSVTPTSPPPRPVAPAVPDPEEKTWERPKSSVRAHLIHEHEKKKKQQRVCPHSLAFEIRCCDEITGRGPLRDAGVRAGFGDG